MGGVDDLKMVEVDDLKMVEVDECDDCLDKQPVTT